MSTPVHAPAQARANASPTAQAGALSRATREQEAAEPVPESVREAVRSGGQPLDAGTRDTMGVRFGHDFSKVRVQTKDPIEQTGGRSEEPFTQPLITRMEHAYGMPFSGIHLRTDAAAAVKAGSLQARAYTDGTEIGFAQGVFNPDTREGFQTIAHEFAHIAQFRGGTSSGRAFSTSILGAGEIRRQSSLENAGMQDEVEQEADDAAEAVLNNRLPTVGVAPITLRLQKQRKSQVPPTPPSGSFLVSMTRDGLYVYSFNSHDVGGWGDPRVQVLIAYIQDSYGGTKDVAEEFISSYPGIHFNASPKAIALKVPAIHVIIQIQSDIDRWMQKKYPKLQRRTLVEGYRDLDALRKMNVQPPPASAKKDPHQQPETGTKQSNDNKPRDKQGIVPFTPSAKLRLDPELKKYVKGSKIGFRVDFDNTNQGNYFLNFFPHRAVFHWTIWRDNKKIDTGPHFGRGEITYETHLTEVGNYTVQVSISSEYFTNNTPFVPNEGKFIVVEEQVLDAEIFNTLLAKKDDANAPFERDEQRHLKLKAGQHPLSIDDEIHYVDLQIGAIKALGAQGKLTPQQVENYTEYFTRQKNSLELIRGEAAQPDNKPYIVHGTFLSRETSSQLELKTFMYRSKREKHLPGLSYAVELRDITLNNEIPTHHPGTGETKTNASGTNEQEQWGKAERLALKNMAEHWHSQNDYPDGTIHLGIQMLENPTVLEISINTHNTRKDVKKITGYVAAAGGVIALAASPFTGGATAGVGIIILKTAVVVSAAASLANLAMEIDERINKEGTLKIDRRLALDLLQVVSTVMGLGGFTNAVRGLSLAGKGLYLATMLGVDIGSAVLIADSVRHEIIGVEATYATRIGDAEKRNDSAEKERLVRERDSRIAQILGEAAINGSFLLVSLAGGAHQLVSTVGRMKGIRYTVREEVKQLGSWAQVDQEVIHERLNNDRNLTPDERAYLQEALQAAQQEQTSTRASSDTSPSSSKSAGRSIDQEGAATHSTTSSTPKSAQTFYDKETRVLAAEYDITLDEALAIKETLERTSTPKKAKRVVIAKENKIARFLGVPENSRPLPESLIKRQDGKFVVTEVKNQKEPDIGNALDKFKTVTERLPVVTGKKYAVGRFDLFIDQGKFTAFSDKSYTIDSQTRRLLWNGQEVKIGGLPVNVIQRNLGPGGKSSQ